MKIFYTFLLICFLPLVSKSQCDAIVTSTVWNYPWSNQTHGYSGDSVYICPDINHEVTGDLNIVLVERNVFLTIEGKNNEFIVKAPGDVTINGDSNIVRIEDGVVTADNGKGNQILPCSSPPVFDYTLAKPWLSRCNTVGIDEGNALANITLSPNPVKDVLFINSNIKNTQLLQVEVFSGLGASVFSTKTAESVTEIDLSEFNSGLYIIVFKTGDKVFSKQFLKVSN